MASSTRAADLAWSAPAECPERSHVEREVERLLGRPLRDVEGIDFSVQIVREERRRWRVVLVSTSRAHRRLPRERELVGQSCAEVVEAVGVAVAMASQSASEVAEPEPEPEPLPAEPEPEPEHERNGEAEEPPPEVPLVAAAAPVQVMIGAGLWLDSSALPSVALGAGLELSGRYRSFRLSLSGGLFAPQEARPLPDGGGGRFGLYLGAALLCFQPSAEGLFAMGCAGFELGRVTAEGVGLDDGREDGAAWYAIRAELGAGYRINAWLAAIARLGGVAPISPADFTVNDDQLVHEIPSLSVRAMLGLELYP